MLELGFFFHCMPCLALPGPGGALQPLVKLVLAAYGAPLGVPEDSCCTDFEGLLPA